MAKESKASGRSLIRLFFWELLALVGFANILGHPLANGFWGWLFFYNALFFLVAYPVLYVYRWKLASGCLGMVMWPLSLGLSLGLGISAYLWTAYGALVAGSPYYSSLMHHWVVLGVLFLFVYFPLIQPIWGVSQKYFPLGELFKRLGFSLLGGFAGYMLGWYAGNKLGNILGEGDARFLLWLTLILLGSAVGAFFGGRGRDR